MACTPVITAKTVRFTALGPKAHWEGAQGVELHAGAFQQRRSYRQKGALRRATPHHCSRVGHRPLGTPCARSESMSDESVRATRTRLQSRAACCAVPHAAGVSADAAARNPMLDTVTTPQSKCCVCLRRTVTPCAACSGAILSTRCRS